MALANGVLGFLATRLPMRHAVKSGLFAGMRILDCNGAERLSAALSGLPGYLRADYPAFGCFSRRRNGWRRATRGYPATATGDLLVDTEFGVDAWTFVHRAGFASVALHQIEYPAAIAISAWDDRSASHGLALA